MTATSKAKPFRRPARPRCGRHRRASSQYVGRNSNQLRGSVFILGAVLLTALLVPLSHLHQGGPRSPCQIKPGNITEQIQSISKTDTRDLLYVTAPLVETQLGNVLALLARTQAPIAAIKPEHGAPGR